MTFVFGHWALFAVLVAAFYLGMTVEFISGIGGRRSIMNRIISIFIPQDMTLNTHGDFGPGYFDRPSFAAVRAPDYPPEAAAVRAGPLVSIANEQLRENRRLNLQLEAQKLLNFQLKNQVESAQSRQQPLQPETHDVCVQTSIPLVPVTPTAATSAEAQEVDDGDDDNDAHTVNCSCVKAHQSTVEVQTQTD